MITTILVWFSHLMDSLKGSAETVPTTREILDYTCEFAKAYSNDIFKYIFKYIDEIDLVQSTRSGILSFAQNIDNETWIAVKVYVIVGVLFVLVLLAAWMFVNVLFYILKYILIFLSCVFTYMFVSSQIKENYTHFNYVDKYDYREGEKNEANKVQELLEVNEKLKTECDVFKRSFAMTHIKFMHIQEILYADVYNSDSDDGLAYNKTSMTLTAMKEVAREKGIPLLSKYNESAKGALGYVVRLKEQLDEIEKILEE